MAWMSLLIPPVIMFVALALQLVEAALLDRPGHPQLLLRVGHARGRAQLAPRRPLDEVLSHRPAANAAIATRLGLTEKTVRNNVSNVFAKLRVADRAAAVARARDAGLGAP